MRRRSLLPVTLCALLASAAFGATAAANAPAPEAEPGVLVIPEGAGVVILQDADGDEPAAVCDVGVPVTESKIPDACISRAKRVVMTAVPDGGVPGARFDRWSDYRCPPTPQCTVTLTENRALSALFSPVFLRVKAGSFGPVTLTPPGNVCTFMPDAVTGAEEPCMLPYARGTEVTLERDPAAATESDDEWSGDCRGDAPTCTLELLADAFVRAGTEKATLFDSPPLSTFTLRRRGSGGSISADKGQPRSCKKRSCPLSGVRDGDEVRLLAQSSKNWRFVRWENASKNRKRFVTVGNLTAAEAIFQKKKKK